MIELLIFVVIVKLFSLGYIRALRADVASLSARYADEWHINSDLWNSLRKAYREKLDAERRVKTLELSDRGAPKVEYRRALQALVDAVGDVEKNGSRAVPHGPLRAARNQAMAVLAGQQSLKLETERGWLLASQRECAVAPGTCFHACVDGACPKAEVYGVDFGGGDHSASIVYAPIAARKPSLK